MIEMDEAVRVVLEQTPTLDVVEVDFREALGRVLASDVRSDMNMPPFDKSAMDGYAVIGAEVAPASADRPVTLEVVEEIPAGAVPTRRLSPGQATRIMTGAPIPEGADTVVMVEDTAPLNRGARVQIRRATPTGENICRLGEDIRLGQVVLSAGAFLRPPEIGVLASVGAARVRIHRPPEVAILPTGEEIVEADVTPKPGQIRNSNGPTMCAQVAAAGAKAHYLGIAADNPEDLAAKVRAALDRADILLLSGGVSMGDYDIVKSVLAGIGVRIHFERIRIKPGRPLTFGTAGPKLVFGLPGNPLSATLGIELLVRPALRKMQRMADLHRPVETAVLDETFEQKPGRKQYVPAITVRREGRRYTRWVGHSGSADLLSLSRSNSLFLVEAEASRLEAGAEVPVIMLEEWV
jgi:molybdopterin molybdotransferase